MHREIFVGTKIVNKIFKFFFKKKLISLSYPKTIADITFPYYESDFLEKTPHKLYWIPDFQAYEFSFFFDKEELNRLKNFHQNIAQKGKNLVLSSQDAKNTFEQLFPENTCNKYVLNFAVSHPQYEHLNIGKLKTKYNITQPYFISPNQFWKHKNHITLLKAGKLLEQENFQIIFTGKEYDNRNPEYTTELKNFVRENQLENKVKFLGFIDRAEQLQLMKNALAVIQPSLFEGWSTVVEDAKAMNQFVILSDLAVHKEQANENFIFFEKGNEIDLKEKLLSFMDKKVILQEYNYQKNIRKFAQDFVNIITEIIKD